MLLSLSPTVSPFLHHSWYPLVEPTLLLIPPLPHPKLLSQLGIQLFCSTNIPVVETTESCIPIWCLDPVLKFYQIWIFQFISQGLGQEAILEILFSSIGIKVSVSCFLNLILSRKMEFNVFSFFPSENYIQSYDNGTLWSLVVSEHSTVGNCNVVKFPYPKLELLNHLKKLKVEVMNTKRSQTRLGAQHWYNLETYLPGVNVWSICCINSFPRDRPRSSVFNKVAVQGCLPGTDPVGHRPVLRWVRLGAQWKLLYACPSLSPDAVDCVRILLIYRSLLFT